MEGGLPVYFHFLQVNATAVAAAAAATTDTNTNAVAATILHQQAPVFSTWVDNQKLPKYLLGPWEDQPSSTGSTQFPYNPLTIRMLSSTPPTPIACAPSAIAQAAPHQQNRIWEREPAPLLSAQYETLSDSDNWAVHRRDLKI